MAKIESFSSQRKQIPSRRGARKKSRDDASHVLDKSSPTSIAIRLLKKFFWHTDGPTLWYHMGEFWAWDGKRYKVVDAEAMRSLVYKWLDASFVGTKSAGAKERFKPNTQSVNLVIDALKALAHQPNEPPCWTGDESSRPSPGEVLATADALVHLRPDGEPVVISPPTPDWWSRFVMAIAYDAKRLKPKRWLRFLRQLFRGDRKAIKLLQEFFGYCLTVDTSQQKMLLIVGPKRSGKGTIGRVLTELIGPDNVAAPTLTSLATAFGLWPLIGKSLAIVPDARVDRLSSAGRIIENLLAISGEDALTIDRKHLSPVTMRLATRVMILTNELPQFTDSSGALASRFLILKLSKTFYGQEDTRLTERLIRELPQILHWAIEGWKRLKKRGHFDEPDSGKSLSSELNELSSPVSAFVSQCCRVKPDLTISISELYRVWRVSCQKSGRRSAGTIQTFGRDLSAVLPEITTFRPRSKTGKRGRRYRGIGLSGAGRLLKAQSTA
jgi:putative DNA primase/helicase